MPANDPILLEQILNQRKSEIAPTMNDSDFFELFVAEELLKDRAFSYDEISSGLVGGGNDGGIDGIWMFANGELVHEDSDITGLKKNVDLELLIVQAKRSPSFGEDPINRLIAASEKLLDLSNALTDVTNIYNSGLLEKVELFRDTYRELAGRFPRLTIRYVYASLGSEVHPNTNAKALDLMAKIPTLFSDAEPCFEFVGASELLEIARQQPKSSFTLQLAESPISGSGAVAYICLVKLSDWYQFITSDEGSLRSDLFDANVRDYQGNTEVNKEIKSTLQQPAGEDFWWLNNGITVLAERATQSGKALTIEDPQIVNGLQTSQQIYEYFHQSSDPNETRLVLVRVIVPEEEESRDRIIKATNSQTYIPPASLKATDKVQRDIEDYLRPHGIYYDRRKNYHKNEGKPVADIVGIPKMAQAMMAILLAQPDTARARPSSLIKSESDYAKLFSEDHPVEVFLSCIEIVRAVENQLRSMDELEQKDRNNIRFYAALQLARTLAKEATPSLSSLKELAVQDISDDEVISAINICLEEYRNLGGNDQVAKGPALKEILHTKYYETSEQQN